MIRANVFESGIPLLLSKDSMKKAKIKLDLENDQPEIFGEIINLDCTSSGHYCIPLCNTSILIKECVFSLDGKDRKEKEKLIIKVHKQFAHLTMKKMWALMIDAGVWDNDCQMITEKVYQTITNGPACSIEF